MPTPPTPQRFWWLKRLATGVVTVAAACLGFYVWLSYYTTWQLDARVAAWAAEGDTVLPKDRLLGSGTPPPTLADGSPNGAALLVRAGATFVTWQQNGPTWNYWDPAVPMPERRVAKARALLLRDQAAIALVRASGEAAGAEWDAPVGTCNTVLTHTVPATDAADRLTLAVAVSHHDGDVEAAWLNLCDMLRVPRTLSGYYAGWVTREYGGRIAANAAAVGCLLAWHRPAALTAPEEAAAWREAGPLVRGFIADLCDEQEDARIIRRGCQGDRLLIHEVALDPTLMYPSFPINKLPMPAVDRMLALRVVDGQSWLAAHPNELGVCLSQFPDSKRHSGAAAGVWGDELEREFGLRAWVVAERMARVQAHKRTAAVVLAATLRHAETGTWPRSWDDLVPAYLPRVPSDPFGPPGTPLRLKLDGPVPLVYSIGENLTDEGASTALLEPDLRTPGGESGSYGRQDVVYPLYLPPEAERFPLTFNVWYWLVDPAAATAQAEVDDEDLRAKDAKLAEDAAHQLDVENQQRQAQTEQDQQQRPGEQQGQPAQQQPAPAGVGTAGQ